MKPLLDSRAASSAMDVHPLVEIMLHMRNQQRNAEKEHPREGRSEVFKHPPHRSSPARVGDVVKKDPENATNGERQIEIEREQPGVGVAALDSLRSEEQKIKADDGADDGNEQGGAFHLRNL